MEFEHPADAMRARIEGRLNCLHCKNISAYVNPWCSKHETAPKNLRPLRTGYCTNFIDNITPMHGWRKE